MTRTRRRGASAGGDENGRAPAVDVSGAEGSFDPAAFPGVDARRTPDGGAASERWRRVLGEGSTVLADGAMGTMLFQSGLQFGDPPEVWNLTQPDVVRRIQRGYLEAGSRILLTNTFGGNRLRLALHGLSA
ncbi:MAG: homocysteine S-methyltransferase family protein, partial [Chloroflexota bacterium]|nr:homocysteine S-methyltransferase family protein [Chloroflexota bacterium]